MRNNTLYVSLEDLADLIGFRLMGDAKIMNAVFSDRSDDERVSVYLDTDSAVYGKTVRLLGAQSYFSGSSGDVFVPISFLENSFDNVTLTGVQKGARIDYTLTVSGESRLAYSADTPVPLPDVSGIDTSTLPDNEFLTDLSAYEKYMDPENADEYIRLINKDHPLGKDYIPPDLTEISGHAQGTASRSNALNTPAKALDAMFIEMRAAGFTDVSCHQCLPASYDYQTQRFNDTMNNYLKSYNRDTAYAKTAAEIALPGCSEHQSGLCADLHNLRPLRRPSNPKRPTNGSSSTVPISASSCAIRRIKRISLRSSSSRGTIDSSGGITQNASCQAAFAWRNIASSITSGWNKSCKTSANRVSCKFLSA